MQYQLIIIGGGPGGVAAGVYAARKRIKTLFVTHSFGGQSIVSPSIENWIGTVSISGEQLARDLKAHIEAYKGEWLEVAEGKKVTKISKDGDLFKVETDDNNSYLAETILVATGSGRKKLNVPGAKEFDQKGLTYCASCDGPMFADKDVAVIGGGNAGFETAGQLLSYCKSVTLLHKNAEFKADQITVEKFSKNPKFRGILNAEIKEIKGDKFVNAVVYTDKDTNETKELPAEGVFVEIGFTPATDFVKDLVKTNEFGAIVADPKTQKTTEPGIWAAGDCTDGLYHQNNISVGDAVKALEDIHTHLATK